MGDLQGTRSTKSEHAQYENGSFRTCAGRITIENVPKRLLFNRKMTVLEKLGQSRKIFFEELNFGERKLTWELF